MANTESPFNILVIDSEESSIHLIKEHLSQHSDHPVHFELSRTSHEALDKIAENRYHAILVNHSLDGGKGVREVIREINRRKISTPLIVMVPPNSEAEAHRAIKAGATDYLVKTENEIQKFPDRFRTLYRNYELKTHPKNLEDEITAQNMEFLQMHTKLRDLATRDELTGLYNHRYLQEKLIEEFARAVRYGHSISCLMIDLDFFRSINDQLGHATGDEILKEAAEILLMGSRLSDLIARFGGEEFVILLPHVDYQGAAELAERFRETFARHTFLGNSQAVTATVSIGVSSFPEDAVKDRSDLLHFADQAVFRAKAGGRNQVYLYRNIGPTLKDALPHLKISEEKIFEFQRKLSEIADKARRGYVESSKMFIQALDSKDHFTAGHAGGVAKLAMQVAEASGLSLDDSEIVGHAGLLHDIGKICISDEILLKPSRLTLAEYEAMKQHHYFGYRIVKPIKFLREEATLILHHHEWFNGEGYPCCLAGNEIPLGARIVSVVDSYDTMRLAGGRYKQTLSVEAAVNELIACAGTQFDPEVVQTFIQVLLMKKELAPESYNRKRLREVIRSTSQK